MSISFSTELKHGTTVLHQKIESCQFIQAMLKGHLTMDKYIEYLQNLLCIYNHLERRLDETESHNIIHTLAIPKSMMRQKALINDLTQLNAGIEGVKLLSTQKYMSRLDEISPELLVAHAYIRYLGDMSGGKILASRLSRHLGLKHLTFYQFHNASQLKKTFKENLDVIGASVSTETKLQIVSEANAALQMFIDIFAELFTDCFQ